MGEFLSTITISLRFIKFGIQASRHRLYWQYILDVLCHAYVQLYMPRLNFLVIQLQDRLCRFSSHVFEQVHTCVASQACLMPRCLCMRLFGRHERIPAHIWSLRHVWYAFMTLTYQVLLGMYDTAFCKSIVQNSYLNIDPDFVVFPLNAAHVQVALAFANQHQLRVVVSGAGHDHNGRNQNHRCA